MSDYPAKSATPSARIPLASEGSIPVLHELRISKDAEEWLKTLSPSMFENYDQIQRTWNAPLTQFTLTLVQDAELKGAASEIALSHLYSQFFAYEAVLIFLIWILRAWRLSKAPTWLTKLWTQAWIALLYWLVAAFLIPGIIWGAAYRTVLVHLVKAVFLHFFR